MGGSVPTPILVLASLTIGLKRLVHSHCHKRPSGSITEEPGSSGRSTRRKGMPRSAVIRVGASHPVALVLTSINGVFSVHANKHRKSSIPVAIGDGFFLCGVSSCDCPSHSEKRNRTQCQSVSIPCGSGPMGNSQSGT